MGPMRLISLMGLIGLMGLGLMGCSKDQAAQPQTEKSTEVQLMSYVAEYDEAKRTNETNEANGANGANGTNAPYGASSYGPTRGWIPPSGFSVFDDPEQSISVFFTQTPSTAGEERFFFTSSGKWRISGEALTAGTYYYLYGYLPHDKSITTTASVLPGDGKTYADGAVVTMTNVPTVSTEDFCVMIAARNGDGNGYTPSGDYSITGLQRGHFEYVASGVGNNYVFLLFEHLFSAMRLRMRVQGDYNDLRTIKLKELKLKTFAGEAATKKKTNVTITLTANNEGNDPITGVTFTPYGADTEAGSVFTSEAGFELNEDYQEFTGHFMPQGVTSVILESTYDVYDKKGNLVRPGCTSTNTLNLNMFSGQTQALRGRRYTVNLTINPTFLHVMSDPDLDDPLVTMDPVD